ncbi:MAG TPA: molybdopterin-dependent oxidoreductase [Gemmataceae bacterium]|nr:molybdopterin-dependent oxidoreductase [Gemmataceae bacterium]
MATVYVNDKPVEIGNERLNVIQAAQKGGVFIPHYCWHPALTVVASCRMCLVEVGEMKDGKPVMQPKVVPGCQTPVKDGTVVVTNSDKARQAQMQTLESLLLNHPLDCPVCDKAGECMLQDFSYRFGRAESRMIDEKHTPPNKPGISDKITLFTDRCIMCSRCVRFTREIAGTAELQVVNRGDHSEIDIFPGQPLENKLAGNVVDLCPVGALCSKDFLYKQRVWYLKEQKSVCADCSTGCSVFVDSNKNVLYRLRPRPNPQAQGYFICDEGRFGFHYVNSAERFRQPMLRRQGALTPARWPEAVQVIRQELPRYATQAPGAVAGVLSPFLTCEEAYLLAKYLKGLSSQVMLALGPVPVVGEDDSFPKNARGEPVQPLKFTIRAEKCPNRRGVEEVLRHFQGEVVGFDRVVRGVEEGKLRASYVVAGYPPRPGGWVTPEQAKSLAKADLLVVHDLLPSPASEVATHVMPAAAWAEKDGTFVNHAGLAQAIRRAVIPVGEFRTDGQVFLDLLERRGLLHAPTLRKELAEAIPYFALLASADPGELGIRLGEA